MTTTWQDLCERAAGWIHAGPLNGRPVPPDEYAKLAIFWRQGDSKSDARQQVAGLALFARLMAVAFDEPPMSKVLDDLTKHWTRTSGPWIPLAEPARPAHYEAASVKHWASPATREGLIEGLFYQGDQIQAWKDATGCATPAKAAERIENLLGAIGDKMAAIGAASAEIVRLREEVARLKPVAEAAIKTSDASGSTQGSVMFTMDALDRAVRNYRTWQAPNPHTDGLCLEGCDGKQCPCDCHGGPT